MSSDRDYNLRRADERVTELRERLKFWVARKKQLEAAKGAK